MLFLRAIRGSEICTYLKPLQARPQGSSPGPFSAWSLGFHSCSHHSTPFSWWVTYSKASVSKCQRRVRKANRACSVRSYPRLPGMFFNLLEPCILLRGGRIAVPTSVSCSHGNLCNAHHCCSHHQLLWGLAQAPFLFAKTSTSLKSAYPSVSLSCSFWAWDLEPCHAPASSSVWGKDMSTELSQLVC